MAAVSEKNYEGKIDAEEPVIKPKESEKEISDLVTDLKPTGLKAAFDGLLKIAAPSRRSELSRMTARRMVHRLAELAQKTEVAHTELKKARKSFNTISRDYVTEFINRMEVGETQRNTKLSSIATKMRQMLDDRREEVRNLGRGYLQSYYENYFPHIWKNPEKATTFWGQFFTKRPLEGKKAFLKKRSIMFFKEGIEYGLEPVSWNPVDLVLLKSYEIDRFLMAQKLIGDLKEQGLIKFKYARSKMPEGYRIINDRAFTVYMPPEITVKEAYDKHLMDSLMDFAKSIDVKIDRIVNIKGGKWGYAEGAHIVSKFAGPESVLYHEMGHVLGDRYGLFEWMTHRNKKEFYTVSRGKYKGERKTRYSPEIKEERKILEQELRVLADQRYKDQDTTPGFKQYVRRASEKEAVMLEAFIHAPKMFKRVAPTVYNRFVKFLNEHAELRPLLDIEPTVILEAGSAKMKLPGVTKLGDYVAPEHVATLINNHLSPGLRNADNALISGSYDIIRKIGNALNQSNLSLSFFHGLNTTTDTMATTLGHGIRQVLSVSGQRLQGIGNIISTPVSPFINVWRGDILRKEMQKDFMNITDPQLREIIETVIKAGGRAKMDMYYHNMAAKSLVKSINDMLRGTLKEKAAGAAKLPFNIIGSALEVAAKPVMEWLVPRQKLGAFSLLAKSELKRHHDLQINDEQLWERLVQSWNNVDNRMGQLVYDNLFWSKTLKDTLMMAIRSVGWNLGSWREYAGAPIDFFRIPQRVKEGDAWLSQKMAYTIGAVIVYAVLGAVIQKLLTGKAPEETRDYFFPKTGNKNKDGSWERLSLPTYAKDWYAYSERPFVTISHKMHPLWSTMGDMLMNEDYYGTEIRHSGDPLVEQLKDEAEHIGKSFLPFSVRNYMKMRKDADAITESAITSAFGIVSAPAYITRSPAQKLMSEYIIARLPKGTRTKEQFERSQMRKELIELARTGKDIRVHPYAEYFQGPALTKIHNEARRPQFQNQFKRLTIEEALNVYIIANEKERKEVRRILDEKYHAKRQSNDIIELYSQLGVK